MRILFFVALCSFSLNAVAQTGKVISANTYLTEFNQNGEIASLNKARGYIDEAVTEPKGAAHPRTWYVRGMIYLIAAQKANDGKFKDLDNLNTAFESFKKSLEIDGKYSEKEQSILYLKQVGFDLYNEGVNYTQASNFIKGYECFAKTEEVMDFLEKIGDGLSYTNKKDNMKSEVQRADLLNNQLVTAKKAGMIDKSIELFNKQILLNPTPDLYRNLASIYLEKKDMDKCKETLEKGIKAYPTNINLMIDELNIYLKNNQKDQAIEKFKKAIELDPSNTSLLSVLGSIYYEMGKYDEAKANYEKVLSINGDDYNANFNLAAIYNTKANELIKRINALGISEADNRKADALKVERNKFYSLAKPYLDKCIAMKPEDEEVKRIINKINETIKN